jgi:hypothetical protein
MLEYFYHLSGYFKWKDDDSFQRYVNTILNGIILTWLLHSVTTFPRQIFLVLVPYFVREKHDKIIYKVFKYFLGFV